MISYRIQMKTHPPPHTHAIADPIWLHSRGGNIATRIEKETGGVRRLQARRRRTVLTSDGMGVDVTVAVVVVVASTPAREDAGVGASLASGYVARRGGHVGPLRGGSGGGRWGARVGPSGRRGPGAAGGALLLIRR
ncbi:hypothetical protein PR202_ga11980 [Eleusine coracana subsp. coracana]|uniref:Uncharacterized protein n=1 Tax=Eleusine coracana subsp. coracana TaxID=191504 RepID=A0AAV5CAD7_ELECO|nr:hypothetical protein PR202_ga11980 [Eleusine coracana subsp. coracana]